jgi:hypothetical protein
MQNHPLSVRGLGMGGGWQRIFGPLLASHPSTRRKLHQQQDLRLRPMELGGVPWRDVWRVGGALDGGV